MSNHLPRPQPPRRPGTGEGGQLPAAEARYRAALQAALDHESISVRLDAALCLSALAATRGDSLRAVELAAYVENHPASEFALKEQAREKSLVLEKTVENELFSSAVLKGRCKLDVGK